MKKLKGIHFYINIINFNEVILEEEKSTGNVTHALHALDTFFSSIETYGKKHFPDTFVVEKITGSRLHLYVTDDLVPAFQVVKTVSAYAYQLCGFINTDIPKYKTLKQFYIQVGVAYGEFYDFEFSTREGFTEETTIGYVANYAAKLQAKAGYSKITISEEIYDSLPSEEQKIFEKVDDSTLGIYDQSCYYTVHLVHLMAPVAVKRDDLEDVKIRANRINLSDIEYAGVRKPLNFRDLSTTQCKRIDGIPVFADIRDFTSQFTEDDSNLEEMRVKTQEILEKMYRVSTKHGGIHIQFQGDRELSLYHNIPESIINGSKVPAQKCFKAAVLAAMRMIDAVKPYSVHIGVGEDFGRLFATKLGARNEKDNVILGETVIRADHLEDKKAGPDQIAISTEVYSGLQSEDRTLANQFMKSTDGVYIAKIGLAEYSRGLSFKQQERNTKAGSYNKAWGDL